jgi:perosamine synthetase
MYKNHGRAGTEYYEHDVIGYNYRLTNVQAAIGCAQFERFDTMLSQRARHDAMYRSLLSHPSIRFPQPDQRCTPVCWQTTLRVVDHDIGALRRALAEKGIDTRPVFTPLHLLKPFGGHGGMFPIAEAIARESLSLPSSNTLSDPDVTRVAETLMSLV